MNCVPKWSENASRKVQQNMTFASEFATCTHEKYKETLKYVRPQYI